MIIFPVTMLSGGVLKFVFTCAMYYFFIDMIQNFNENQNKYEN